MSHAIGDSPRRSARRPGPRPAAAALLTLGCLALAGCAESGPAPPPPAPLETNPARVRALAGLPVVDVESHTGPGGLPFAAAARTPRIGQYPCTACHDAPLAGPGSAAAPATEAAASVSRRWSHLDVRLQHAEALRCATCHRYEDLGDLRLIDGEAVDFDRSHRVCAQCHSTQARDWAGGAHGKRLGGWRGARVVESCTGCHDPHAPAFPQRMPLGYPRVPRTGGGH